LIDGKKTNRANSEIGRQLPDDWMRKSALK